MRQKMVKKAVLSGCIGDKQINESHCVVPISLGQPEHENDDFSATVTLLKLFQRVTFVVADTLHRHTRKMGGATGSDEEIKATLREEGRQWRERNQNAIDSLGDKLADIIYWDTLTNDTEFQGKLAQVNELYNSNSEFKSAVSASVNRFVAVGKSAKKNKKPANTEANQALSRQYIIEECAALLLWVKNAYNFIIYPFSLPGPMNYLLHHFVRGDHPDLLKPLTVNLKTVKQQITISTDPTESSGNRRQNFTRQLSSGLIGNATFFVSTRESTSPSTSPTSADYQFANDMLMELVFTQIEVVFKNTQNLTPFQKKIILDNLIEKLQQVNSPQDECDHVGNQEVMSRANFLPL